MLFNSIDFLVFLPIVLGLHWLVPKRAGWQNLVLLSASLFFYGWWNWRVLGLFVVSVGLTVLIGRGVSRKLEEGNRRCAKVLTTLGVLSLLLMLGFFKYYNFFIDSLASILSISAFRLELLLPLGISFYTFMCVSYLIDVYTGKLQIPTSSSLLSTFSYLSFFPQIAAGPIGRGPEMLPQFSTARTFDCPLAVDGCRQFLWGLFKKMVIADGCARLVGRLFANYDYFSGSILVLGAFMYAIQIYCDFSGYSDMAIGVGKLFGIRLRKNFNFPYFVTNIGDFWRRWHISLTKWFTDYVYIPLGGSRCWLGRVIFNTWVVFLLSGLWHGAAWTYVIWGAVHAALLTVLLCWKRTGLRLPSFIGWIVTMTGVVIAWVFFRAPTFAVACGYLHQLFSRSLFTLPTHYLSMMPWILFLLIVEWFQRNQDHGLARLTRWRPLNWSIYMVLTLLCIANQQRAGNFIYFQF